MLAVAAGHPLRAVWLNGDGGLTFEILDPDEPSFIKFAPAGGPACLFLEAEKLKWAQPYTPVPRVLDVGQDSAGAWLRTAALPAGNAVEPRWKDEPALAVAAIGHGLRALHDALPVASCPFDWGVDARLKQARFAAEAGQLELSDWPDDFAGLSLAEALDRASRPPPIDRLVVCHGDACAPNTLVDDQGRWAGHVDFEALGVADRWADLAVAAWSLEWNFGSGWDETFYAAYGVRPDPERIAYYRLMWRL